MEQGQVGFSLTRTVHAPVQHVWDVLGDFGTEHRWTRTLLHCERDTPGVGYDLDGPAGPFLSASSRWSTTAGAQGTTLLTVEGRFVPRGWLARFLLWPLAKPMIRRLTHKVILELEQFVTARPQH